MKKVISFLTCASIFCVHAIAQQGIITTYAGNGVAGYSGDGYLATTAALSGPFSVATDSTGNVFFVDYANNVIRKISLSGIISTVVGNGSVGYSGDGGPATAASMNYPKGVTTDAQGNLYIADIGNHVVRKVSAAGIISTVAGTGIAGNNGDGALATTAALGSPACTAMDKLGNLYVGDIDYQVIRKVDISGNITTVAGNDTLGYCGDGGAATLAELFAPSAMAVDSLGNLYIADYGNNRIRKVDNRGIITTVAGNGIPGYSGNGGLATSAELWYPSGIAVDGSGNILIADQLNNTIRMVNGGSDFITNVAGTNIPGYSGDGGAATAATLNNPVSIATDRFGNIYIADALNNVIRKVEGVNKPLKLSSAATDKNFITVIPNPNNGVFEIRFTNPGGDILVEVSDVLGRVIYTSQLISQNHVFSKQVKLDNNLSNGNYFLYIKSITGISTCQITIE